MPTKDIEYFRERAKTERALGLTAIHPKAMAAHRELAERYDALVLDGAPPTVAKLRKRTNIAVAA
ncbi:MAG TPA: hypothetical protein VM145_06400 [Sphingomicrobium sp.]|nr:hypothetical protein [Sphingomicrobium sp.]